MTLSQPFKLAAGGRETISEEALVKLFKDFGLFPAYCTRKKIHSCFYLLRKESKTGISLLGVTNSLFICADSLQMEGLSLLKKAVFMLETVLHSQSFETSLLGTTNKANFYLGIHSELKALSF
jgi:hypothetical protein